MKIEICTNTAMVLVIVGIVASVSAALSIGSKYRNDSEARIAEAKTTALVTITNSCLSLKMQALAANAREPECPNVNIK